MKKISILLLVWLATVILGRAQELVITNAGWFNMDDLATLAVTNYSSEGEDTNSTGTYSTLALTASPAIAEAITPEIQALADGLQRDPVQIYNYVHDHIRHVLYFGSKKGATLTLLERSGNDFDQCALLVALLRAAGYSDAAYQFGWVVMPYENADGSHRDLQHWLGLSLPNTNWSTTADYLNFLFKDRRLYPATASNLGNNNFAFQRVWVTLPIDGKTYLLDPAFKVSEFHPGIDLKTATGFDSNALMVASGGFATDYSISNLNEAGVSANLTLWTSNLLSYIQSHCPNASVSDVLGGWQIVPENRTNLSMSLVFPGTNLNGSMPVTDWINQPTNLMSTITIKFGNGKKILFIPELKGQRLSLVTGDGGTAYLRLEDVLLLQRNVGGGKTFDMTWDTFHPSHQSSWDTTNNVFVPGNYHFAPSAAYASTNGFYALLYSFEPDWYALKQRQRVLEQYRAEGISSENRLVIEETLNIMGMNWNLQYEAEAQLLAALSGALPQFQHRFGRMGQEPNKGYYVDVYSAVTGAASGAGRDDKNFPRWFDMSGYFGSAMEHGIIEQLQAEGLKGYSTIKVLAEANARPHYGAQTNLYHEPILLLTPTNWPTLSNSLASIKEYGGINDEIRNGGSVLVSQSGGVLNTNALIKVYGQYGDVLYSYYSTFTGSARRSPNGIKMVIGSAFGGYASVPTATVSPTFIGNNSYASPFYFSSVSAFTPNLTGADPVSMGDGTFQVEETDLTLGQTEPRGLNFSRFYSSGRRNSNLTGLGYGWGHNYYLKAETTSAPEAGLGGTTPAQCAAMLTANYAAMNWYDLNQPTAKNWLVAALIANWAIDQVTKNAVTVSLGKDSFQFIRQPDSSFTPPANCTMTLTGTTNDLYTLQERHGRRFQFNTNGWCTNIADAYNKNLILAYTTDGNLVKTVTDWMGRKLTFTYSSQTPPRLDTVADNAGRTLTFTRDNQNLIAVADQVGQTASYDYDADRQLTATFNAKGQLVASNIYNPFGRVTTQYTQGDTNKTWKIFWSGWQTVSQDPAGGKTTYFYDDKTRLIAQSDALGNISRKIYDGQDHIIATVSPLNETNVFTFDDSHNVTQVVDALGYTNWFFYDDQNNLVTALDARSNPTTFGYNAEFQITGQTNAAGDWINFAFDAGDGLMTSRTDAGGMTGYGYDALRQLNSITYPGGLGGESFANNYFGDVTNHVNARGFATAFKYDTRRQLTNTIAPTNLMVKVAYDAVGNVVKATDARGNVTSNVWSATRQRLKTTLPNLAAVTNHYDSRDWLVKTVDPLQRAVLYTNDAAGQLLAQSDPLQRTVRFGRDANGNTLAVTNAAQRVTRQVLDAKGRSVKQIDGAQHTSAAAYDAAGNQTTLTNRNGKVWRFGYDAANRVTNTASPLGRNVKTVFNHRGLPESVTDSANQTTTLNYDAKGRITNRTDNLGTTGYAYDAGDNLTNVVAQASSLSWAYDAYGRVTKFTDAAGNVIQYRYDANGNVTNLIYPGGKTVTNYYNALNQLTNVTDWSGRKTVFTYDLAGQMTGVTRPNGSYRSIGYDAAGQVTNILDQMANTLPIVWFKFNWTNTGNMAWEFIAPLPHAATVPTRTMTYDDDNRLLTVNGASVASDANGNLTNAPLTNATMAAHVYDTRNRLLNVGGIANTYDPSGNRIAITSGTNSTTFVVNPNASLSQVLMRIKNGVTNYYIYGAGLLYQITETASGTNSQTYHFDYRGSTVALSADNGQVTDRMEYSVYGLTTYRTGSSDTPFLFNGKYGVQTDNNGLLYMRARFYNPYLCRFISSDPSGFGGGLNMFAYANGNPVNFIDPFGLGAAEATHGSAWLQGIQNQMSQWQEQYGGLTFEQQISGLLNMAPFVGAFKMAGEVFGGNDFVTGESISDPWSHAGAATLSLGLSVVSFGAGAAESGMAAPVRWTQREATLPTESLALVPRGARSLGLWGEARLAGVLGDAGIKPSKPFTTSLGNRYVDRLAGGIAHESKAGINVGLTSNIRTQILKDLELIEVGQIQGAHWHFFQGAKPKLLDFLTANEIPYTVH